MAKSKKKSDINSEPSSKLPLNDKAEEFIRSAIEKGINKAEQQFLNYFFFRPPKNNS